VKRRLLLAVLAATLAGAGVPAQQPSDSTAALVERTGKYVEEYERTFAAVVSEEFQRQTLIRADGRVRSTRELRSDFLLVKTGPDWAHVFRDVIEVDGRPVRNREDRLRRLFIEKPRSALQQARDIAKESARYNIGPNRVGNSPLVPLLFLHPRQSARSRFAGSAESLIFEEVQRPTILGTRRGSRRYDLPARGSFIADAATGRVLAGEFTAAGPSETYSVSIAVRYAEEPQLKLMVPSQARERYWFEGKPKEDRLEVESTYSNFRRFHVVTEEQIKIR
jgi:hypothetical protein